MRKLITTTVIFCILAQACTFKKPLEANAYTRYMEDEQSYIAEVSFKDSEGKTQNIEDVFFMDGAMEKRNSPSKGILYKSEKDGTFVSPMLIKGKNEKGEVVDFKLDITPIINLGIKEPQLSRTNGFTLAWEGTFAADEELMVLVTDEEGTSESLNVKVAKEETQHFVEGGQLKALGNGKGTISIIKVRNYKTDGKQVTVKALVEYYTKAMNILINE
jgi:hypothetical protein